jgi:hypothetical protein
MGSDALADAVPDYARTGPVLDGRHGVMRQVARDVHVPLVHRPDARVHQPPDEVRVPVCAGVVLVTGDERARAERHSQYVVSGAILHHRASPCVVARVPRLRFHSVLLELKPPWKRCYDAARIMSNERF